MTDTPAEVAEKAISFIEDVLDYPLQPWQATTLRAMLTYPVGTRFAVWSPPQHPQRKGFDSDYVVVDEWASDGTV